MVCTFDCCVGNNMPRFFEVILDEEKQGFGDILKPEGLELINQLHDVFDDIVYFNDEEGFSQTPEWIPYQALTKKISDHIKLNVRIHKSLFPQ